MSSREWILNGIVPPIGCTDVPFEGVYGKEYSMRLEGKFTPTGRPRTIKPDFTWPDQKVAVEADGGVFMQGGGGHQHPEDYIRNMEKNNFLVLQGWIVLHYLPHKINFAEVRKALELHQITCCNS